ncbi:MAG: hypothetical protein RLZZ387_1177 [Chloroflexota bacterium]|jgi:hypothetical protein
MDTPSPALRALAADLRARAGADAYYIFWFPASGGAGGPPAPSRERTLVAFPSPDTALAFAQRSVRRGPGELPRLRRLMLPQLIESVAREPAIAALLLVAEPQHHAAETHAPGALPAGLRISRDEIIRRLHSP